jgi:amino acid adenylation domain-containing protein
MQDPTLSAGDLRRWLESRVPAYMIPAHWVVLDAFPLNSSGKLDRRALPAPGAARPDLGVAYADPATALQTVLAAIWRDLLRRDSVGIHDSFFALGGHSLLATQVISRLRDAIGAEVPVRLIFERPTIAGLAEALGDAEAPDVAGTRIVPRASFGSVPLSFPQQRLWFLDQIDPGTALFNIQDVLTFRGRFRQDALEAALSEVVRRHEVLRTGFTTIEGVAAQMIGPAAAISLRVVDLTSCPRDEREEALADLCYAASQEPFVLSRPPLFRAKLAKMGKQDHRLLLTLHHIVADGWSLAVLHREIEALYSAFCDGRPSPLPDLPVQYADYAVWQRARLGSGVLQGQVDYWMRQLANPPRALEIPLDRPRPPEESSAGARQTLQIPSRLAAGIRELCARTEATPFMLLLAAFDTVLHRYTGQTDLVVGCPVAGRTRAEIENLVGFFLNTLVLRVDASGDPTFAELLERVRQTSMEAFANQEVPYEKILEDLAHDRSRAQLFRIYFNVISFDTAGVDSLVNGSEAAEGEPSEPSPAASIFDFTLYVFEQGGTFVLDAVYRTDLYEAATVERLLRHIQATLDAAVSDSTRRLTAISLPAGDSPRRIPPSLAAVRYRAFPAEETRQSVAARFEKQASRYARNPAVRTRNHDWTYAELRDRARHVAAVLVARGTAPGDRVALLTTHDGPMLAGLLGTLMAGAAYVPLDPSFPHERHERMIADSGARCVITDLPDAAAGLGLDLLVLDGSAAGSIGAARMAGRHDPDAVAYILYTSGSTGQPKGVAQTHRNLLHHCRTYTNALRIGSRDRLALVAALGSDAAVMDIFGALLNGATLCPIDVRQESPESFADWLHAEEVTLFHATPTVYRHLLGTGGPRRFPSVRAVVLGGEEAVARDAELFRAHFPTHAVLVNGLGPTESTLALQYFADHDTTVSRNTLPVGYAVDGTEVLLLDGHGDPVAGCGTGELAFRSRHVAPGYWRQPALSAAVFHADPADPSLITYRTGDLGHRLPDGRIEFTGRKDLQVKIRGVRIELAEIECRLLEYPGVQEAVVCAFDADAEPGGPRLAAFVTASGPDPLQGLALGRFLRERLPEVMVPSAFVTLDSLPRTATGKIDRRALRAPESAGAAVEGRPFVVPSTATERTLAGIWSALLRVPEISATDDFFELGGHSLLATQLASRVRTILHVELPLRQYFMTHTLGALASLIDRSAATDEGVRQAVIPRASRDLYRVRVSHAGQFLLPAALTRAMAEAERTASIDEPGSQPPVATPLTADDQMEAVMAGSASTLEESPAFES